MVNTYRFPTLLLLTTLSAIASAQTLTVSDPTPVEGDRFGRASAINGNYIAVGAEFADTEEGEAIGQAHLFDATTGLLIRTFNDPTPTRHDYFGEEVAIDGDRILIAAWSDDTRRIDAGQAHLFDIVSGDLLHTFDPPNPRESAYFGHALDISGNHIVVGGPSFGGQAHVFDATTGRRLRSLRDPRLTGSDSFGGSLAIDGNRVLVGDSTDGTQGENIGQAYLFDITNGRLLHTFNDPTPTERDGFGLSVAIDGDLIAIGASRDDTQGDGIGQAHVFSATTGDLLHTLNDPTPTGRDRFGGALAIEGDLLLVGADGDDTYGNWVGQAHLFDTTTGELLLTYDNPSDPLLRERDAFGVSVALDGNRVLVGENAGEAHLFEYQPAIEKLGDLNGDGVLDAGDIDLVSSAVVQSLTNGEFDLNDDGLVNGEDRTYWVKELAGTKFGDTNLDGIVNFSDFLILSAAFDNPGGWAEGDFDGNGLVQFPDFLQLAGNFGQTAAVNAVPEPSSCVLLLLGVLSIRPARHMH